MAKKWTPSQKQLQLYDELLKRQNITRKRLLRRRRIIEEEGSFGRPLPDLVIPMKAKRHRDLSRYANYFDSYADYRNKMRALRNLYGGKGSPELQYYKETYRKRILEGFRNIIHKELNFPQDPDTHNFGRYTEEQIDLANKISNDAGRYLELYNKMVSLETSLFMDMYDFGNIPMLKYIYSEITEGRQLAQIDEFLEDFSRLKKQSINRWNIFYRPKSIESRQSKLASDFRNIYGQITSDYNKHKK